MDQNITDLQKRRADNIIWNCAKDYSFVPDFKAYDSNGNVDIYWNIIFGSARHHYEYKKLEKLFAMLDSYKNSANPFIRLSRLPVLRKSYVREITALRICFSQKVKCVSFTGFTAHLSFISGGVSYDEIRALTDTAHEVRRLRACGFSVICIFTGEDEDIPSAKMVYGQDFVRIRDFSLFADTVGKLIINQIKSYSA